MRHLFIINPSAGKGSRQVDLVAAVKALPFPAEIVYTQKAGDCERITREAAETGEAVRIYACGGDGTLNEAVNGAAGFANAAVTNVPLGTGNDFLKIFGKESRARFSDLPALAAGPQAAMDLIDCNGRLGIDIVCVGLDARVAAEVHKYKALPLVSGIGAYILSIGESVASRGLSQPMAVRAGDLRHDGETALECVCSGRFYGGGFMPVGDNMPDDGLLETLVIPRVSFFTFARLIGKYASGHYRDYPDKIFYRQGADVTVRSEEELTAVVDGEVLQSREFSIRLSEKKVNFFYPADVRY